MSESTYMRMEKLKSRLLSLAVRAVLALPVVVLVASVAYEGVFNTFISQGTILQEAQVYASIARVVIFFAVFAAVFLADE